MKFERRDLMESEIDYIKSNAEVGPNCLSIALEIPVSEVAYYLRKTRPDLFVCSGYRRPWVVGRKLLPGEQVHHINWNPDDNRKENLAILSGEEHTKAHNSLIVAAKEACKLGLIVFDRATCTYHLTSSSPNNVKELKE